MGFTARLKLDIAIIKQSVEATLNPTAIQIFTMHRKKCQLDNMPAIR